MKTACCCENYARGQGAPPRTVQRHNGDQQRRPGEGETNGSSSGSMGAQE